MLNKRNKSPRMSRKKIIRKIERNPAPSDIMSLMRNQRRGTAIFCQEFTEGTDYIIRNTIQTLWGDLTIIETDTEPVETIEFQIHNCIFDSYQTVNKLFWICNNLGDYAKMDFAGAQLSPRDIGSVIATDLKNLELATDRWLQYDKLIRKIDKEVKKAVKNFNASANFLDLAARERAKYEVLLEREDKVCEGLHLLLTQYVELTAEDFANRVLTVG